MDINNHGYEFYITLSNDYAHFMQMIWWLHDEVGMEYGPWFHDYTNKRLLFSNEEDKVKFILRWM